MTASAMFAAEILRTSAKGLASLASDRLLTQLADSSTYGDDPRSMWREHLAGRLADLSLALGDEWPAQFQRQVGWAKVAFAKRGAPESDLELSLRCLKDVIESELPQEIATPAATLLSSTIDSFDTLGEAEPSAVSTGSAVGELATRYMVALLEGDRRQACDLVLDTVRRGDLAVREAIVQICLPVQRELGRMWHVGDITIAEEHFVSATTVRLLSQLLALETPRESNGKTVLAATLDGDEHDIGLRAVSDLFELDGWRTVFLGRGLPVQDVVWAANAFKADLVMLSATLPSHVRPVRDVIARLAFEAGDKPSVPVIVGGPVFMENPELGAEIGAAGTSLSARDAVADAARLLGL